jgi:hypothetical protein
LFNIENAFLQGKAMSQQNFFTAKKYTAKKICKIQDKAVLNGWLKCNGNIAEPGFDRIYAKAH